ncbi:MAG: ATP-binding protein [Schleiferiaceae bacterium]
MAFDLKSIRRNEAIAAPRLMVYGVEGIGKSTFAAAAPKPIFILTEDGLGSLQVDHFPLATKYEDVLTAIQSLYTEKHDFETVALDSVDWLENLIWRDVESKHDAKDLAYGKGAVIAADRMRQVLDGLNALRNERGMAVILIAHTQIKRFDSPETEPFDRYQPKMQDRTSALVREWCDAVLFANYKTVIKKDDVGFNKTVSRGVTTGERLLFTNERPAYMAKNRYGLPDSIPFSWTEFVAAIK